MSSLIFCPMNLSVTDRGVLKSVTMIVIHLFLLSVLSVFPDIVSHFVVRCIHIKNYCVFLENRQIGRASCRERVCLDV